jgi:hypothetical protein
MDDDDRADLRRKVADLTELRAAKRRREKLRRDSQDREEAVKVEEGLIDRIDRWAMRLGKPRPEE